MPAMAAVAVAAAAAAVAVQKNDYIAKKNILNLDKTFFVKNVLREK